MGAEAALVRAAKICAASNETAPLDFDSPCPYCRTKALAEQAVRDEDGAGWCLAEATARP
jgi:nucleoside-diphosphate-sugar epimerase